MTRIVSSLAGPELYWLVTYAIVRATTRRHQPPDPAITSWLDQFWAVLPLVVVPLTFAFLFLPGAGRWWLLLRIDLAIAIGLAIATTRYCEGMTYHQPSAGPGAGTAWMLMLSMGYMLMLVLTAVAALVIWWRGRVPR